MVNLYGELCLFGNCMMNLRCTKIFYWSKLICCLRYEGHCKADTCKKAMIKKGGANKIIKKHSGQCRDNTDEKDGLLKKEMSPLM